MPEFAEVDATDLDALREFHAVEEAGLAAEPGLHLSETTRLAHPAQRRGVGRAQNGHAPIQRLPQELGFRRDEVAWQVQLRGSDA